MQKRFISLFLIVLFLFSLSIFIVSAQKPGTCVNPSGGNFCGKKSGVSDCFCDDVCANYGDCCIDYNEVCKDTQTKKCPLQPYGPPYNCPIVECLPGYTSVQDPVTCCYKCKKPEPTDLEIEVKVPSSFSLSEGQSARIVNYEDMRITLNKILIIKTTEVPPSPPAVKITVSTPGGCGANAPPECLGPPAFLGDYTILEGETIDVLGLKITLNGVDLNDDFVAKFAISTAVSTAVCGNGICEECEDICCPSNCVGNICTNDCLGYCPQDCESKKCVDTDGGKNEFVAGKTYINPNDAHYDTCGYGDYANALTEYYCSFDSSTNKEFIKKDLIQCQNGCKDGACVTSSTNNPPKIVGFPAVPTIINVNQPITFSWTAIDEDNDYLSWSGAYDDGSAFGGECPSSSPNKEFTDTHSWSNPGTYVVSVAVSDCKGGTDKNQFKVKVTDSGISKSEVINWINTHCS